MIDMPAVHMMPKFACDTTFAEGAIGNACSPAQRQVIGLDPDARRVAAAQQQQRVPQALDLKRRRIILLGRTRFALPRAFSKTVTAPSGE